MRKPWLAKAALIALLTLIVPSSVIAQGQSGVIPCSEFFGEGVQGIILFTQGGTPSVFTCAGGIFLERGDGPHIVIPCSDFYGPDVHGQIIFTNGMVSVFSCQGGPFN